MINCETDIKCKCLGKSEVRHLQYKYGIQNESGKL